MVQIKNDFITDTSQSDAKIARLQAQILKLKEAQAEMHREGKEGTDLLGSAMNSLGGKVMGLVGGYVSVSAVLGAIRKGYEDWASSARKAADETDRLNTSIMQGMAEAGKIAQMPQLEAWMKRADQGSGGEQGRRAADAGDALPSPFRSHGGSARRNHRASEGAGPGRGRGIAAGPRGRRRGAEVRV